MSPLGRARTAMLLLAVGLVPQAAFAQDTASGEAGGSASPAEEPGSATSVDRPEALRLAAGVQVVGRRLRWKDGGTALAPPGYQMSAAPAAVVNAAWYPGAHFTEGAGAAFGLRLRFEHLFATESRSFAGSASYPTRSWRVEAGVEGRVDLAPFELRLGVGYGDRAFGLESVQGAPHPGLPNVQYRYGWAQLAVSVPIAEVMRLDLEAGYHHPLAFGDLASDAWFPRTRGGGVAIELGLAFLIAGGWEVRAVFSGTRYFLRLDPEPTDPVFRDRQEVAGGAVDRYLAGTLELGWRY